MREEILPEGALDADQNAAAPWNPGLQSQIPKELLPLCTIFRSDNVYTGIASAEELHAMTGFELGELVVFRPQRLALHELLIRVTADFAVPDGSQIGDLGINFRRIAGQILAHYLVPGMDLITQAFERARSEMADAVEVALDAAVPGLAPTAALPERPARRLFARGRARRSTAVAPGERGWGPAEITECERRARAATEALQKLAYHSLARVLSALFTAHGHAWGTRTLIGQLANDIAFNTYGSDAVGRTIEPMLLRAAREEGYGLLPYQDRPIVINTKGASASGKSTLRPLQKKLAGELGMRFGDFALISPDIWRKQLLDYSSLGAAYKYAGAFTGDELQIVDRKLDRYMARKHESGRMTHLLIDRFRFDSFAQESDEEGSNLLTRFGQDVYLFFVITAPEQLVERAWKRGLEFGRYKAVDDTLAHAVEAYTGIPNVLFTWVRRGDKHFHFEFLDNTVPMGERPRTVAFGDNDSINVLDVNKLLTIDRYGRISVGATCPEELYLDRELLDAERNTGFLKRCVEAFRIVNFADQASGRIYLTIERGNPVLKDPVPFQAAVLDADTLAGVRTVAPRALYGDVAPANRPRYLSRYDCGGANDGSNATPTLGAWGDSTEA
ncbi:MAG TPA: hypothetical protein VK251_03030 [Steroidobacteraceae bacterium]|nr:hypothetical protein [Steroidobacteraceae bacterium]